MCLVWFLGGVLVTVIVGAVLVIALGGPREHYYRPGEHYPRPEDDA